MGNENPTIVNTNTGNRQANPADEYPKFQDTLRENFNAIIGTGIPLFTTNAEGLFDIYLNNLNGDSETRQHYNCRYCKKFVDDFGGLVTISEAGEIIPVLWNDENIPQLFADSVRALKNIVSKSTVTGVFKSDEAILGRPITGEWHHMSVRLPLTLVNNDRKYNAEQVMAEKIQEFEMMERVVADFPTHVVDQTVALLQSEFLDGSQKVLGPALWFKALKDKIGTTKDKRKHNNFIWLAVATAPTGFCHIRSSLLGTLFINVLEGESFESIKRKFAEMIHPLRYQRPQAAPSDGNIAQAEKLIAHLKLEPSLERRFARLDEIVTIWKPKVNGAKSESGGGIFSHLKETVQEPKKMELPKVTMTWRKFSETVLPVAENIEYMVGYGNDNFAAIVTATHDDAPPILHWDRLEQRNPFSWYLYHKGSSASHWGLKPGYVKVTGITNNPALWYGNTPKEQKAALFILEGAKDTGYEKIGNGLFPGSLIRELHEIRATIEAHSARMKFSGFDEASACGVMISDGGQWTTTFRVTTNAGIATYKLDRWE